MLPVLSLAALSNVSGGVVSKFLGGLLLALYLPNPITIEHASFVEQPSADQLKRAQQVIHSNPACLRVFIPETGSPVTLDDFGLTHQADMPPVHFVNIWATWCAPCRAELPILVQLSETVPASINMLNLGDSPEIISKFAEQIDAPYESISTSAPENILQTINAQGLPYNAVFYGNELIGSRNQAIHDAEKLNTCLTALYKVH